MNFPVWDAHVVAEGLMARTVLCSTRADFCIW